MKNLDSIPLILGPCSAESRSQVMESAQALKNVAGLKFFRAGLWKPRTKPNSFEGVGAAGISWLTDVKQEFELQIITEVAKTEHVELALNAGFDAVWIGARTTVNPFSVQELAESLKGVEIPIFIKNPINPDLDLWIGAFERFEKMNVKQLYALHRGFSVSNKHPYRNKPMWEIPISFRTKLPGIPLYCDPSHISGNRTLLSPVAQRALDLGFDGLMFESHEHPDGALSDAKQQVTAAHFQSILGGLLKRCSNEIHGTDLAQFREQIDTIDQEIIEAIGRRMQVAQDLGQFKKQNDITIFQLNRWKEILQTRTDFGRELGLTEEFMQLFLEAIHKESIRKQNGVMNANNKDE